MLQTPTKSAGWEVGEEDKEAQEAIAGPWADRRQPVPLLSGRLVVYSKSVASWSPSSLP